VSSFNASRFADPNRTDVLPLGPCQCPGTPHEAGDQVVYRQELGAGEMERVGVWGWAATGYQYYDSAAARCKLIEIGVVRWNLLGPDGQAMDVTVANAALLDDETQTLIAAKLDEVTAPRKLPKGSGGRSPNGHRANGSPTRRASRGRSSTTSSSRPVAGAATT
jgi:hypothetical protein